MLHRLLIICITGFWLAMTALLVVREVYPESTRLNAVPIGYVWQLMFQHEQTSYLNIFSSGKEKPIGNLQLQPRSITHSDLRNIEVSGNVSLTVPGGRPQRVAWAAVFEMRHDFTPARLRLDVAPPEQGQHWDLHVDFADRKAVFSTKVGGHVLSETAFTLDAAGFGILLSRAGLDATLLRQLTAAQSEMPGMEFGAQSSSTVISGQKLATFLVSLKAGGQSVFEAQVSQLGQVLSAKAPPLGWKFTPTSFPR